MACFPQVTPERFGVIIFLVDISRQTGAFAVGCTERNRHMTADAVSVGQTLTGKRAGEVNVVIGFDCGTGGEVVMRIFGARPTLHPKVLIAPLLSNPCLALAYNILIFVPTPVDVPGLNELLRQVLVSVATTIARTCNQRMSEPHPTRPAIGLTALGVTGGAAIAIQASPNDTGIKCVIFRSNGFGGAGLARRAEKGVLTAVFGQSCHELNRPDLAGDLVPTKNKFTTAAEPPQTVLPCGPNVSGRGPPKSLAQARSARTNGQYSTYIIHVKAAPEQSAKTCEILAGHSNETRAPVHVVVPICRLPSRNCPGCEVEDDALPDMRREILVARARHHEFRPIPHLIGAEPMARRAR
ncbi:MAG: Tm-1-like ATP-binding domain-containing protein [Paracoccaceae bacterium]|nr:Tm-1-like ATP-binding domain-containing protein [Paracoccaceae bacterium]